MANAEEGEDTKGYNYMAANRSLVSKVIMVSRMKKKKKKKKKLATRKR
jgi:hypothetical protein